MERREAIRKGIGGLALTLTRPAQIPAEQPSVMKATANEFYEAWEEASLAQYWGEHKRSHYYYHQALKFAPEDIEPEALAEVIEGVNRTKDFLASWTTWLSWRKPAGT
jgi:hypothetical protein